MDSNSNLPWKDSAERYDVTVIVPTFNRAHCIQECIDSLLAQTHPAIEILVIDDGSEDTTKDVIQAYGDDVTYIYKDNGGKPSAVNLGLSLAKGNLIWLFDDDDVALSKAIESRIRALKDNPSAGFVYSPHYIGSSDKNGRIKKDRLYEPSCNKSQFLYKLLKGCFFHLASTLVRIEAYQKIGGFDEELLSSEDYDVQIRLSREFSAAYCQSPSFIFRHHSGHRGAKSIRYSAKNRTKVFLHYDQVIGRKIYSSFKLDEYHRPEVKGEIIPNKSWRECALLSRMVVMASKGCIDEMFMDLAAVLELIKTHDKVNEELPKMLTDSIKTGYAYQAINDDWPAFKSNVRELHHHKFSGVARSALARGFFQLAKSYPGSLREKLTKLRYSVECLLL